MVLNRQYNVVLLRGELCVMLPFIDKYKIRLNLTYFHVELNFPSVLFLLCDTRRSAI